MGEDQDSALEKGQLRYGAKVPPSQTPACLVILGFIGQGLAIAVEYGVECPDISPDLHVLQDRCRIACRGRGFDLSHSYVLLLNVVTSSHLLI